ncbi:MAG: hypothetical protein CM1200mP22_32450 [Dehalococcoidia bacterium]|nr:MAG: hypothetical protein CM1200mP22_32450 [Dehalococcoidia bacterium]
MFGTINYSLNISIINARILWFPISCFDCLGHILAVYLAHRVAIRTFADRSIALRHNYPMLSLMVIYTVVSLWNHRPTYSRVRGEDAHQSSLTLPVSFIKIKNSIDLESRTYQVGNA